MSCNHKFLVSKWSFLNGVNEAKEYRCHYCLKTFKETLDEVDKKSNKRSSSKGVRSEGDSRASGQEKKTD